MLSTHKVNGLAAFSTFAPDLYKYYTDTLLPLYKDDNGLLNAAFILLLPIT